MPKLMKPASVIQLARTYWPAFLASRETATNVDKWVFGRQQEIDDDVNDYFHGKPFMPKDATAEHDNLMSLSPSAFGGLVVKSLAQTVYVKGVSLPGANDNLKSWESWLRNGMRAKQSPLFRAAIGHGAAYGLVLPGQDRLSGDKMARIIPRSAKRMAAFYEDDNDEWATIAIEATEYKVRDQTSGFIETGWNVTVHDDLASHDLRLKGNYGEDPSAWTYLQYTEHPLKVCPVARLVNQIDLDGRAVGEIEPVVPLLRRIDQDTFDRLIVQRFGAWAIRYIAGMAKPATPEEEAALAAALRVEDLLISDNTDTKFGSIPGSPVEGFIGASDADLRTLAAITQTPPHHLLGMSANMQAEALDAAEQGLKRKSTDFKLQAGEFSSQLMRMAAVIDGNTREARAFDMQTHFADTEAQSFQSTAQALGIAATQLGVPLEMLWERLPNWTDNDTERAKKLVEDGTFEKLVQELMGGTDPAQQQQQSENPDPAASGNQQQ